MKEEINKIFNRDFKNDNGKRKTVFRYQEFKEILYRIKHIIYLADNAGVVFDRLLIKKLTEKLASYDNIQPFGLLLKNFLFFLNYIYKKRIF